MEQIIRLGKDATLSVLIDDKVYSLTYDQITAFKERRKEVRNHSPKGRLAHSLTTLSQMVLKGTNLRGDSISDTSVTVERLIEVMKSSPTPIDSFKPSIVDNLKKVSELKTLTKSQQATLKKLLQ